MKVLFVCRGNVGRSQMASALFDEYTGIKSDSGGTKVGENEGQKLKGISLAQPVIRFMENEGLDVSENTRSQINSEDVKNYDKIIVMAEPSTIPDYLRENEKVDFWDIEDPKGMDDEDYQRVVSEIKEKVKGFVNSNGLG